MKKVKIKNKKEFKELIKDYEAVTYEDMHRVYVRHIVEKDRFIYDFAATVLGELTGFGSLLTCKLCIATQSDCVACAYNTEKKTGFEAGIFCAEGKFKESYYKINNSKTPIELMDAIEARVKVMKKVRRQWKKKKNEETN